jgi:hypothetical protein
VSGLVHDDVDQLRAAVKHTGASPLRVQHACALVDLGAALRRGNARADARQPLREALELARACGADGLARAAEEELEATGVRVPPRPGVGADALTPAERRIARLAASVRRTRKSHKHCS